MDTFGQTIAHSHECSNDVLFPELCLSENLDIEGGDFQRITRTPPCYTKQQGHKNGCISLHFPRSTESQRSTADNQRTYEGRHRIRG